MFLKVFFFRGAGEVGVVGVESNIWTRICCLGITSSIAAVSILVFPIQRVFPLKEEKIKVSTIADLDLSFPTTTFVFQVETNRSVYCAFFLGFREGPLEPARGFRAAAMRGNTFHSHPCSRLSGKAVPRVFFCQFDFITLCTTFFGISRSAIMLG